MADLENDTTPNDSEALGVYVGDEGPGQEQEHEENEERATITSAVPIFNELLEWFDEMIAGADSIAQLKGTMDKYKATAENAVIAHHIVESMLDTKKEELVARFGNFLAAQVSAPGEPEEDDNESE